MRIKRNTHIEYPLCYRIQYCLVLDVLGHIPLLTSEEVFRRNQEIAGFEKRAKPYYAELDTREVSYRVQADENLVVVVFPFPGEGMYEWKSTVLL